MTCIVVGADSGRRHCSDVSIFSLVRANGILSVLVVAVIMIVLGLGAGVGLLLAVSSVAGLSRICAVILAQLDGIRTGRLGLRLRSTACVLY